MQILLVMLLLVSVIGCGADELSTRLSSTHGSFGNEIRPPTNYYRALLADRFNRRQHSGDPQQDFLEFWWQRNF